MSILDELRELCLRRSAVPADMTLSLNDLDAFEAAHPGLKDSTTYCVECRAPFAPDDFTGFLVGLCPACAKEANDD